MLFGDGAGALRELVKELGRDVSDCGGTTPLARFLELMADRGVPHISLSRKELEEDAAAAEQALQD